MTLDEILSQVAGGFNLQALSLDNILRAVLVLAVGVVAIKLIQRAVERILSRNAALAPIHRYLRSALSVVLWLLLALVLLGSMGVELTSIIALLSVAGLAVSLALTLILEGLLALLWGVKDRWDWLLLLLVNVVTNPIVVSLHHLLGGGIALTVGLELFAVVSEWLAYRKWGRDTRPAFLFSLCANGFSYCSGVLLNALIWRVL